MTKPCSDYINLMHLYLDGRLAGGQYQELMAHLDVCESCRKRMTYLRVITAEVRAEQPPVPENLHAAILENIHKNGKHRVSRRVVRWVGGLAACAAMLLFLMNGPLSDIWKMDLEESRSGDATEDQADSADQYDENFDPSGLLQGSNGMLPQKDGENSITDQPNQPEEGDQQQMASYAVPKLMTSEQFFAYIIATGITDRIQEKFSLEDVVLYPEEGQIYIYIDAGTESVEAARATLEEMGLTVQTNPENLPDTVPDAPNALIVIFPD